MQKIAFVFPGQGSQTVGMLADIASKHDIIKQTFIQASQVLNYDLWDLCQNDFDTQLNNTEFAQPALLVAGYAMWQVWLEQGKALPYVLAGHSLGEYTALVCSGALDFVDAIKLVAQRGKIMQEAVPVGQGGMGAIIGLDEATILAICQEASQGEVLQPASYNSIGQIVVAGTFSAVERSLVLAQAKKAKIAKMLPVSIPSHCALMQPAANKLNAILQTIKLQKPTISVINNADVAIYTEEEQIKDALVRQLYSSVRWVEVVQKMQQLGIDAIYECGPKKVLTGLNKRIVSNIECNTLEAML